MRVRLLNSKENNAVKLVLEKTGLRLCGSSVTEGTTYRIAVEPENLMTSVVASKLKKALNTKQLLVNSINY